MGGSGKIGPGHPLLLPAAMLGCLAVLWVGGAVRLAGAADEAPVEGVTMRLVQPGTRQADRMIPENRPRIWSTLVEMTADARGAGVTHVVWPEAAAPYLLGREQGLRSEVSGVLGPGMAVIAGAFRGEAREGSDRLAVHNSIFVLNETGAVAATYDKHHLVPFGEYMPARDLLAAIGIGKIVSEIGETSRGPGPRTIAVPGAPAMGAAICYEIIFPGAVTDPAARPGWIANLTDDDWFGQGIGPRQHLAIARMRAIEENLPVARVANNGITAMIDRTGALRGTIPLNTVAHLDVPLPAAGPRPLYGLWGDAPLLAAIAVLLGCAAWLRRMHTNV